MGDKLEQRKEKKGVERNMERKEEEWKGEEKR